MLGDVPDPTVTKIRFGFEEVSLCKEGLGERGQVCGWTEKREEECNPTTVSVDRKRPTLDRQQCRYSYPLGRQTNSDCDEIW